MEIDAPTFNCLNKPQKRALMLRDQLRYCDTRHLDSFMNGISGDEPPVFKRINGTVQPPLVMVTLKDTATSFDLGNVRFDNEEDPKNNGIYRAYLTVEDGCFQLRTEDALPADEVNLGSVPIHVFIARAMVPMFETKFKAIFARKEQINVIRQIAFNRTSQQAPQFQEGETLARLDPEKPARNGTSSQSKRPKKRKPGDPITKHAANKRNRVGLDTIPDTAKSSIFNAISDTIKVDLFNNVIKTAFPNFDDLMMASWNVVSVYSNVGTDFPELHKAIVELKGVLQDFEEAFGGEKAKGKRGDIKVRHDFAPPPTGNGEGGSNNGANGHNGNGHRSAQPTPDITQDGASDAAPTPRSEGEPTQQQQDDLDSHFGEPEPEPEANDEEAQHAAPAPRSLDSMTREHDAAEAEAEEEEQHQITNTKADRRENLLQPSQRYTPDTEAQARKGSLGDSSTRSSPMLQHHPLPRERVKKTHEQSIESKHEPRDVAFPELLRRREEYCASSLSHTELSATNNPKHAPLAVQSPTSNDHNSAYNSANEEEDDLVPHAPPSPTSPSFSSPPPLSTTNPNSNPTFSAPPCLTTSARTPSLSTAGPRPKSLHNISTTDLRAKYRDRKAHLNLTFGGGGNVPQQYRVQMAGLLGEIKAREAEELEERGGGEVQLPNYLENSVLGRKKGGGQRQLGSAPVAPMAHMRKEGGGAGKRAH